MFKIDVRADIDDAVRHLDAIQRRHIPFATSLAINNTAKDVRAALQADIRSIFDRPTAYTQRAIYIKAGNKKKPEALVWLKNNHDERIEHYISPHIFGGKRRLKPFEHKLQRIGILPRGMYVVPGAACPLDAYGNISRGLINQVLSYLGASEVNAGSQSNTTERSRKRLEQRLGKRLFGSGGIRGHLVVYRGQHDRVRRVRYQSGKGNVTFQSRLPQPGIWVRAVFGSGGDSIRPLLIFVKQPTYRKRWDFFGTAQRVSDRALVPNFRRAIDVALSTAR